MNLASNPHGTAAVPDGRGGIMYVPHAGAPQDRAWGHYRYTKEGGIPAYARGPQPAAGTTIFDWIPDARDAPQVAGVPFIAPALPAKRAAPLPAPIDRLARYDQDKAKAALAARLALPAHARALPTDLQLQAGTGGINPAKSGTDDPAASADASWAASRARVAAEPKTLKEL